MRPLAALVAAFLLAGCIRLNTDEPLDGHARLHWGQSSRSCNNGACTYDQNAARLEGWITCRTDATLGWTSQDVIHGSARIWVEDGQGDVVHDESVAGGRGNRVLDGAEGVWTLHLDTTDLNGQLTVTLSCP